ncbi:MAG: hypothetical protein N2508_03045 [Anaerolineae bacterium]|nr:hypothetical protein [Anaerolineae bacterium]
MTKLEELLQQVRTELGTDFVATDVVGMDGLSIAGGSINPHFSSADASARFAMVMKLAVNVSKKLNLGEVEDGLVMTDQYYILTRFLGDHSYYWSVTVTRNATLGMVRMVMNEYADHIWQAIPK